MDPVISAFFELLDGDTSVPGVYWETVAERCRVTCEEMRMLMEQQCQQEG